MALYSHTTYSQFRTLLASRLGDSSNVFFTDNELKQYTLETLRTWNAIAQWYRTRKTFNTSNATVFYDLTTVLSAGIFDQNLKDQDIYKDLKYALMEDVSTANTWTGTDQFDQTVIQNAIEKRRNQFLLQTGIFATRTTTSVNPVPSDGRVGLPDSVIDVRRCAYTTGGVTYPLHRNDELDFSYYKPSWYNTTGVPKSYSMYLATKNSIQLSPVPSAVGTLDYISINTGAACDLSTGVILGIPDDWCWAIKWGALADLLSREGQSQDAQRAQYAEARFQDAVQLASIFPSVHLIGIGTTVVMPSTIYEIDQFKPTWQSATSATPTQAIVAGRNLLGFSPTPNGATTITLDLTANMPVPSADGDNLQIGREQLEVLLDYAVHLASFKMGTSEVEATTQNAKNLFDLASQNNERLQAEAGNLSLFQSYGKAKVEQEVPRRLQGDSANA